MTSVLWVSSEAPDFALGGGAMRQAHLMKGLAGRVDRIDLLLAGRQRDPDVRRLLGSLTELEPAAPPPATSMARRRAGDLWKTFVLRQPAEAHDRRIDRRALAEALGSRAGSGAYDVVHVEHLGLAGIVPEDMAGLRSLDIQNVPSRMAAQTLALEQGTRQRVLRRGELAAARRFQAGALAGTDVVSVVSDQDAADLGVGPGAAAVDGRGGEVGPGGPGGPTGRRPRVLVVPNGVEVDRFPVVPAPVEPRLVFTGTLDFLPNVEGIAWFVAAVLPLVRSQLPDVTLDVVGRRPPPEVRALAGEAAVRVHADVDDVVPHLTGARVAVVPVRIGSGSRLKVLEAMAAGRPVVSTSIGVEGLAVEFGRHALVADGAPAMAAAIVELCRDDGRASEIGEAGRRLVVDHYDWGRIAESYAEDLLGALAESGGDPS